MVNLQSFTCCIVLTFCLLFPLDVRAKNISLHDLKAKADKAVAIFHEWASAGRDVSEILPKMKRVKVLADSGRVKEAYALINEILTWFEANNNASPGNLKKEIFVKNTEVRILGYKADAMEVFISRDGRYMFFNSEHDTGRKKDIYYAEKVDDYTFQFKGEVRNINTNAVDGVPTMDKYGNFYYVSTHAYRPGNLVTVYCGKFKDGAIKDIRPVRELSLGKHGWLNMDIEISADGQTLYSTQTWFGDGAPPTKSYFFYAKKVGDKFIPQKDSAKIFKHINKDNVVYAATISNNELEILYTRMTRKGGAIKVESLRATRPDKNRPFGQPRVIKTITGFSEAPALTNDGRLIYYHKKIGGPTGVFKVYALHRRGRGIK